jgi:hypothetical protein
MDQVNAYQSLTASSVNWDSIEKKAGNHKIKLAYKRGMGGW